MLGQIGSAAWAYAGNGGDHSAAWTVQTNNTNVFAEVALSRVYTDPGNPGSFFAEIGISQVVANGQTEDFTEDYPRTLWRTNVSSVTYLIGVYSCFAEARLMANQW